MTGRRGRPGKGDKSLSRHVILSAAYRLLDREGASGLTMRALARALDVNPMAIYHHVGGRDDLLATMVKETFGDATVIATPGEDSVEVIFVTYLRRVLEHPNLTLLVLSSPKLMEIGASPFTEAMMGALKARGIAGARRELLLDVLVDYTHGFAFAAAQKSTLEKSAPNLPLHRLSEDAYRNGLALILN